MTCIEQYMQKHPEADPKKVMTERCPNGSGGIEIEDPRYCHFGDNNECSNCWNRQIPGTEAPRTAENTIRVMLDPGAKTPTRAHETDAGLDLYAMKGGWIFPKCRKTFGTGTHASIPAGYVGLLTSKSGLMDKKGITSRGTIDSDYTGEIRAVLFNHSWRFIRIKPHQKVTQLVILPIVTPYPDIVDSLEATDRGNGGFGSTGAF